MAPWTSSLFLCAMSPAPLLVCTLLFAPMLLFELAKKGLTSASGVEAALVLAVHTSGGALSCKGHSLAPM